MQSATDSHGNSGSLEEENAKQDESVAAMSKVALDKDGGDAPNEEDSASDEGGAESDAEEELKREEMLRQKLAAARAVHGNQHETTATRILKLVRPQPRKRAWLYEFLRTLLILRRMFPPTQGLINGRYSIGSQVSCLIGEYKLNETEILLDEIMPFCKEKGGTLYIKAIQFKAFNLFKQYKFKEALQVPCRCTSPVCLCRLVC
jgi:hypothetical protein